MYLNTLSPKPGSQKKKVRVGRGIGSGIGKTCGKGHKGQKARAGGYHRVGFEGGQVPLQRRLPKFGFISRVNRFTEELPLHVLNRFQEDIVIDLLALKQADLIKQSTQKVKIILSKGEFNKKVSLRGIAVTAGVRDKLSALGGSIAE